MFLVTMMAIAAAGTPNAKDSLLQGREAPVAIRLNADVGFVGQLYHRLQIDNEGTQVNVQRELGQDILYPFLRFQVDLDIGSERRHTVSFLYQPLDFQSVVAPSRTLRVGEMVFPRGEALEFRYGFPFYRATYLYDLVPRRKLEVAIGAALQIRNANISYTAVDGSAALSSRDVGPVPLLAFRARGTLVKRLWLGGEVTGFYAPISVLNGSTTDVVGAVADTAVKVGLEGPKGSDIFLALRYIGGGSTGTSPTPDAFAGDGYLFNWVHFGALSIGAGLR